MPNLKERIERLEAALADEGDEQLITVRLIGPDDPLFDVPAEQWLTFKDALAQAWRTNGTLVVTLDADAERQARVAAAAGGKN